MITVSISAPDAAWRIQIEEIRRVDGEMWVLSRLIRREGMAAQRITAIHDAVAVEANGPLRHFVMGKGWHWGESSEAMAYLADCSALPAAFFAGTQVFIRTEATASGAASRSV